MNSIQDLQQLKGQRLTIGFGSNRNRIVVRWQGGTFTMFAGESNIELAPEEPITTQITPNNVMCEEVGLIPAARTFCFRLGKNRFLSMCHMAKDDLHVIYLPDESEIEDPGQSQFMDILSGDKK